MTICAWQQTVCVSVLLPNKFEMGLDSRYIYICICMCMCICIWCVCAHLYLHQFLQHSKSDQILLMYAMQRQMHAVISMPASASIPLYWVDKCRITHLHMMQHVYVYVYVYVCVYMYVYVYVFVYVYVYVHNHTCIRCSMCMCMYMCRVTPA